MSHDVTVTILTFNGDEYLRDLLTSLVNQETQYSYEILVIDSGSSDGTLEICKEFSEVRIVEIPNHEFGHGRTRNLAVSFSDSTYMAFLTQDAVPSHPRWLDALLEPFEIMENISCVFGKQIPRPDCVAIVKREVELVFSSFGDDASLSVQRKTAITESINVLNTFFSDVNSAVRRECVLEVPFQDLNYAEDQALAVDHLNHGWFKVYAPLASVMHSHNYPLKKYFSRKMDECIGLYDSIGYVRQVSAKQCLRNFLSGTIKDMLFIKRDRQYSVRMKLANIAKAPAYNYALQKCYWLARDPSAHSKLKKHSLETAERQKITST